MFSGLPPDDHNAIEAYPNPTSDHVIIDNGNYALLNGYSLEVTNLSGQSVFQSPIDRQQFVLDLNSFGGYGTYLISVYDGSSNLVTVRKIILQ